MISSPSSAFVRSSRFHVWRTLAPIVVAIFLGFLAIGIPLAALALEVHDRLRFGPGTVGCVIGLQALVTLLTRHASGTLCDRRGPRSAVLLGLPLAALAGLAYALSSLLPLSAAGRLAVLMLGRIALGFGESLFLTGLMSWGIARVGTAHTGTVMSWSGIAIYAAFGLGAPLGLAVQAASGFASVGIAALAAPMLAWFIALRLPSVPAPGGQRVPFHRVLGQIWRPGMVLALATVPYATIGAFLALDYATHGWQDAGTALLAFATAYVSVRLVASGLPDRVGAPAVAVGSLGLETAGQLLLWYASVPQLALVGATLSGMGFSLVFPAMRVLATRLVPPEQRGRAIGNFISFADIAMGLTGPVVGVATGPFGVTAAFLAGAGAASIALLLLVSIRLEARR